MINTIKYGGEATVIKEGEETKVAIPPRTILFQMGAFLEVTITHPRSVQANFESHNTPTPAKVIRAMIDTGASGSVISPEIADELQLIHTGYRKVSSVQDEQERPVYYGLIIFKWGGSKEIPIVSCPLKGSQFDFLIGRDILMHWYLTYNGHDGSIVICD